MVTSWVTGMEMDEDNQNGESSHMEGKEDSNYNINLSGISSLQTSNQ